MTGFSIVTVARENLAGLQATWKSVRAQQGADFEWIVIDGGSRDGSADWLAALADLRVRYGSEPDEGIYHAMNKGAELARGDYLLFLNAGDSLAAPSVLRDVRERLTETLPDILYGDSYESGPACDLLKPARRPEAVRFVMFTHHQAIFYRRGALPAPPYDVSYRLAADWVLTARMFRTGATFLYHPAPICRFERGGASQNDAHRRLMNADAKRVILTESGLGPVLARPVWWGRRIINFLRRMSPDLYDRIRYSSRP